ncbi:MAG: MmcQ/YjbR family DNA-binding protein [Acidobacteriota bacterium]
MTPASFRRLALSLPGTEEHSHMNHPDFRVAGRIFATLGYPDATRGMVKLFPDQQAEFVAAHPEAFVPVKGAWGKQGCTQVVLKAADKDKVRDALRAAWERAANSTPKRTPAQR